MRGHGATATEAVGGQSRQPAAATISVGPDRPRSELSGDGVADAGALIGLHEGGSHASVVRCRIDGFRQWGINFVQSAYGRPDLGVGAVALDNVVTDINDPDRHDGTDAGGIWTGGSANGAVMVTVPL